MISSILDFLIPSRITKRRNAAEKWDDYRFQLFLADKARRENEKHPNSVMAEGVTKCAVGRTWTEKDYLDLIGAIAPGVTLEDFSRATGRSYTGCINRLRMLGIVVHSKRYGFKDIIRPAVPVRRFKFYLAGGKLVDLTDAMCKIGYIRKGNYLQTPEPFYKTFEIK